MPVTRHLPHHWPRTSCTGEQTQAVRRDHSDRGRDRRHRRRIGATAAHWGHLTSGPGWPRSRPSAWKVTMTPLVVIDVSEAAPPRPATKTGSRTSCEALFGRNGESPVAVARSRPTASEPPGGRASRSPPHPGHHLSDRRSPTAPTVAAARGQRPAAHRQEPGPGACSRRRGRRHRLPALRPPPGDTGPRLGRARHPGPGTPHRRAGEIQRHRQHLLHRGQPRPDDPYPRAEDRADRGPGPRSGRPHRRRRRARDRLGLSYGPIGEAVPRPRAGHRLPAPTCGT